MTPEPPFILAIDQGTTSTRAILFDSAARPVASHAIELRQIYPANGWVEHDAEEIWQATLNCCRVAAKGVAARDIAAIGITNQRETTVLWDRASGASLHNAIVWQDRRTAERCRVLKEDGCEPAVTARTGLLLDPYFSATKVEWLLDHIPGARAQAERGELAFGTIDSWLIYKLTGGEVHATDVTNASRTMLLDLKRLAWDEEMLTLFRVPRAILPEVRDSAGDFGATDQGIVRRVHPHRGRGGRPAGGRVRAGLFRAGRCEDHLRHRLLRAGQHGRACARLAEPAACDVGLSRQGRDGLCDRRQHLRRGRGGAMAARRAGRDPQFRRDRGAGAHARKRAEGLYFVPAFTGLGAPYWDPDARGAILGLTRDMGVAEIARAALDAVCFQTRDLLDAMARDMTAAKLGAPGALKVDGGMVKNDWFCQRLADLTGLTVDRPKVTETTALGAAYLAGLSAGVFRDFSEITNAWALDRRFEPGLAKCARDGLYAGWLKAVERVQ